MLGLAKSTEIDEIYKIIQIIDNDIMKLLEKSKKNSEEIVTTNKRIEVVEKKDPSQEIESLKKELAKTNLEIEEIQRSMKNFSEYMEQTRYLVMLKGDNKQETKKEETQTTKQDIMGYCVYCSKEVPIVKISESKKYKDTYMIGGSCSICGEVVWKTVKKEDMPQI